MGGEFSTAVFGDFSSAIDIGKMKPVVIVEMGQFVIFLATTFHKTLFPKGKKGGRSLRGEEGSSVDEIPGKRIPQA